MYKDALVILWYRAAPYGVITTILNSLPSHIRERCYSVYNHGLTDWAGLPDAARTAFRNHHINFVAIND